ncbi:hypothetical protein [Vibrio mediterranei]|uniref:hypothetical protein n=1 Tax=Vibrio mediterranei TaxID=689 RepID=UPI001EFE7E14|nr:hypothetical protein [Vibrio mediterranei]MCG9660605.1 hypothetical protein [Vibrio mediterranei]
MFISLSPDCPAYCHGSGTEVSRTISKGYSGYVHAASPHIMDMYGGNPPKFYVTGMKGTLRELEHRQDIWNYYYRVAMVFTIAGKAIGIPEMISEFTRLLDKLELAAGKNYASCNK